MKVREILLFEALKKKPKPKPPKPRPKKVLWFQDRNHWHNDLQFAQGGKYHYHQTEENEESQRNIYALDPNKTHCFGVWKGQENRGVTFHKPRPLHAVKHPRVNLRAMDPEKYGTAPKTNIK